MQRLAVFFFGCILLGIGIGYGYNSVQLALFGQQTTGVIISWKEHHLSPDLIAQRRPSRYEYAEVRFKTAQGQVVTFVDNHGEQHLPPIGSKVAVRYNPRQPSNAEISDNNEVYTTPMLFAGLGVFAIGYSVVRKGLE